MLLQLDFSSEEPIYLQIRNQIVLGIAGGRLVPGERLPTIRALADEAGINMMTVNKAYQLLKQEGVIAADRRSGAFVSARPPDRPPEADAGGTGAIPEKMKAQIVLLVSEAKLKGISKDAFLEQAGSLFDKPEV